jgi:hypothetical protein
MLIRKANVQDISFIAQSHTELFYNQTREIKILDKPIKFDSLDFEKELIKYIDNDSWIILVAEENNALLGFIEAFFVTNEKNFPAGSHIYIANLNIISQVQKQRGITIMSKFYNEVEKWANLKNCNIITADVLEHNKKMVDFMSRANFDIYSYRLVKKI